MYWVLLVGLPVATVAQWQQVLYVLSVGSDRCSQQHCDLIRRLTNEKDRSPDGDGC